jgi:hypothetical protein
MSMIRTGRFRDNESNQFDLLSGAIDFDMTNPPYPNEVEKFIYQAINSLLFFPGGKIIDYLSLVPRTTLIIA